MPIDESKARKVISEEWRFILSILTPVIAIGVAWFTLETKVELNAQAQKTIIEKVDVIENNHLAHIQTSMEKIADAVDKLAQSEVETKTLLKQHLSQ
jgi:carbonic anhydrase